MATRRSARKAKSKPRKSARKTVRKKKTRAPARKRKATRKVARKVSRTKSRPKAKKSAGKSARAPKKTSIRKKKPSLPRTPAAPELVAVKIIDTVIVDDARPILPKSEDLFGYPERSSPQVTPMHEEDE